MKKKNVKKTNSWNKLRKEYTYFHQDLDYTKLKDLEKMKNMTCA